MTTTAREVAVPATAPKTKTSALAIAGMWALVAVFFSVQNIVSAVSRGRPVSLLEAVVFEFLYWLPWALLTPVLLWLARRYRLSGPEWKKRLGVHAIAAVVIAVIQVTVSY